MLGRAGSAARSRHELLRHSRSLIALFPSRPYAPSFSSCLMSLLLALPNDLEVRVPLPRGKQEPQGPHRRSREDSKLRKAAPGEDEDPPTGDFVHG